MKDLNIICRELAQILKEEELSSIKVVTESYTVELQRTVAGTSGAVSSAPLVPEQKKETALKTIDAPLVGTFYRASNPGEDPYVQEGSVVKEGTVIGLIEAMKVMNEVKATQSGVVTTFLVEDGSLVEYGTPLIALDTENA